MKGKGLFYTVFAELHYCFEKANNHLTNAAFVIYEYTCKQHIIRYSLYKKLIVVM